jgi:hypothetical protein
MGRNALLPLVLWLGVSTAPAQINTQTSNIHPGVVPDPSASDDPADWLYPIAELDDILPAWLRIGGEYRSRPEGPTGIGYTRTRDFYLLYRLRLQLTIRPRSWLRFHGEVQDSRIFFNHHIPNANPYQDTWTLWEAYVEIGNSREGLADAVAGRQVLAFGDERLIGPSNWLNVGRTFNAARVDLHPGDYKVTVFAASVVPGNNSDLHNAFPGNNLYGVYSSLSNTVPEATIEPYVLWRLAPDNPAFPETVGRGRLNEITIGMHMKGLLPDDFDYDAEFDGQTGSLGPSPVRAWAGYSSIAKRFPKAAVSPRIFGEGNYASGTKHPAGHDWNTFDQIYPSNHDKYGFADLVGRRNLIQFRVGVEEDLTKKWKLKQAFEGYWLATSNDNLYDSAGGIAVLAHHGANRHNGNELDLIAEYQLDKGMSFGFGYARLFAGQFLKTTTPGRDYSYPYAYFQYNFSRSGFHYPVSSHKNPGVDESQ